MQIYLRGGLLMVSFFPIAVILAITVQFVAVMSVMWMIINIVRYATAKCNKRNCREEI